MVGRVAAEEARRRRGRNEMGRLRTEGTGNRIREDVLVQNSGDGRNESTRRGVQGHRMEVYDTIPRHAPIDYERKNGRH